MRKFYITESEKKDILSKYTEIDDKLMVYLRRNFPTIEVEPEFVDIVGNYRIIVDDKSIPLKNNFGRLINLIDLDISDKFGDIEDKKRRQTIKKYLKFFEV